MAAAWVHADREIGDQPDAHTAVARSFLHFSKSSIREPLHEGVQANCRPVLTRKMFRPRPVGTALIGRPINATPFPALAMPLLMQGFE